MPVHIPKTIYFCVIQFQMVNIAEPLSTIAFNNSEAVPSTSGNVASAAAAPSSETAATASTTDTTEQNTSAMESENVDAPFVTSQLVSVERIGGVESVIQSDHGVESLNIAEVYYY